MSIGIMLWGSICAIFSCGGESAGRAYVAALLDEVTSNLDRELDDRINLALASLRVGRVIVTHRQTSLAYADKAYALCGAKLECIGTASCPPSVHEAAAHASRCPEL